MNAGIPDDIIGWRLHDNAIHGIAWRVPEPEAGDWRSEVVLDLDHILEWLPGPDGMRFRIVPATLIFENAADLRVTLDALPGAGLMLPVIAQVERTPVPDRPVPCWRYRIAFAHPPGGSIALEASAARLVLRGPEVVTEAMCLPAPVRAGSPSPGC